VTIPRPSFFGWYALALLSAALFVAALFAGCAPPTAPTAEWSPRYDAAWSAVTACWGSEPERPAVVIQDCSIDKHGHLSWNRHGTLMRGYADLNNYAALVCDDLFGLRHEFSHLVLYRAGMGAGVEDYKGEIPGNCFGVAARGRGSARGEKDGNA